EEPAEDEGPDESQDPEIKLDLARAYLSLGDKEASRAMLEDVLKNGNEEQRAEARLMMEEL
ncbi:MAG: tetratricopeptide repeat protein, partial [Xanthomonadales bacterium]|nr:tetratricopeptide repeat protein [Gammaproteobacteria bacterium]NNK03899.1 tetratricopeptide repeat protein [Xanthomonadales bacterium]